MQKKILITISGLVAFFVLAQFVPLKKTNPPVESEVPASAEVRSILKRACYDCHSNETVWPWYSRVAPASWQVVCDVYRARKKMNFSTWNRMDAKRQAKMIKKSWEEVKENDMPLLIYRLAHPEARLSAQDKEVLREWTGSGNVTLQEGG